MTLVILYFYDFLISGGLYTISPIGNTSFISVALIAGLLTAVVELFSPGKYDKLITPESPPPSRSSWGSDMGLYVVDGIDGSGKNTVADMLADILKEEERDSFVQSRPSDRILGRVARSLLYKENRMAIIMATFFYITDLVGSLFRLRHWYRIHDDVIFVRYNVVAYLPDMLAELVYGILARLLPVPDDLLLVDLPPQTAAERIIERGYIREVFETIDGLEDIQTRMLRLSKNGWTIIDNGNGIENVKRQLITYLESEQQSLYRECPSNASEILWKN